MFIICLLLISLIAAVILAEKEPTSTESAEFIPVPVEVENKRINRLNR